MIVGIGTDLVEIARVGGMIEGSAGLRFLKRVLTDAERKRADSLALARRTEFVAGRFAVKEAVVKAIGCGIGSKVGFRDIEVLPDEAGKPVCRLSDAAFEQLRWLPDECRIHVAIAHERTMATAMAVVEKVK